MKYLIFLLLVVLSLACSKNDKIETAPTITVDPLIGSYTGAEHWLGQQRSAQNPAWQTYADTNFFFRDTIRISEVFPDRVVLQRSRSYPDSLITLWLNSDTCISGSKPFRWGAGQTQVIYYDFDLCIKNDSLMGTIKVQPVPWISQSTYTLKYQKISP